MPDIRLSCWIYVFQDKKLTNAIIDHLIHRFKFLSTNGKPYQMKNYTIYIETKIPLLKNSEDLNLIFYEPFIIVSKSDI